MTRLDPDLCAQCGNQPRDGQLCDACRERKKFPDCPRCGKYISGLLRPGQVLCGTCREEAPPAWEDTPSAADMVNNPPHYQLSSGMECIDITEDMSFCRGNAIKYLIRAGLKGDEIEDLEKSLWYIKREIKRLRKQRGD